MSKLLNQWIDLFRTGDYGDKGAYTTADLDQIASNYNEAAAGGFTDPEQHEAFSAFGHVKPKSDAAAMGWWSKLQRVGDLLQGQMGTVQPEFEDAVERKLFKKRSVGLQRTAKGLTLHHVAWLGGQAPHIKGLANVSFASETEMTEIEFSEEASVAGLSEAETKAVSDSIWERIKAHIPGMGTRPADSGAKTFSEEDAKRIAEAAVAAAVAPLEAKLNAQATQFSERDKTLATAETKQRADAAVAQVKAKGAWVPAFDKAGIPLLFAELAKATETVEFGEGDQKASKTPLQIFVTFMEGLGQIVPSSRMVGSQGGAPARVVRFNETPQTPADRNSVLFHEATMKRMGEKKIDYRQAMREIAEEQPELTRPGVSTSGQV